MDGGVCAGCRVKVLRKTAGGGVGARKSEGARFAGINCQTAVDGGAKSVTERADQH